MSFEATGDARTLCFARLHVGYSQLRLGLIEQARATLSATLTVATQRDMTVIAGISQHHLGAALAQAGAASDGLAATWMACESLAELGLPHAQLRALLIKKFTF